MNQSNSVTVADSDSPRPSLSKPSARVLLVEDDGEVVSFLRKLLVYLGYEVFHAPDGGEALKWLEHELPDVIISDILMPHMDGLKFCRILRRNPRTGLVPVIMLSARGQLQERLEGFRVGADDYIVKPFDVLELKARLESILLRSQREIWCNPISHLPGSPGIEAEVTLRLGEQRSFSFAYLDIDDFKPYNDVYGYHAGDEVIRDLAKLLVDRRDADGSAQTFCGHIGGDDFVYLSLPPYMSESLPIVLQEFDAAAAHYYSPEDRKRGGIISTDRRGVEQFFPTMRLSVGVVNTTMRLITHYAQLAEIASELKHHVKAQGHLGKSLALWDGRSEPPKRTVI